MKGNYPVLDALALACVSLKMPHIMSLVFLLGSTHNGTSLIYRTLEHLIYKNSSRNSTNQKHLYSWHLFLLNLVEIATSYAFTRLFYYYDLMKCMTGMCIFAHVLVSTEITGCDPRVATQMTVALFSLFAYFSNERLVDTGFTSILYSAAVIHTIWTCLRKKSIDTTTNNNNNNSERRVYPSIDITKPILNGDYYNDVYDYDNTSIRNFRTYIFSVIERKKKSSKQFQSQPIWSILGALIAALESESTLESNSKKVIGYNSSLNYDEALANIDTDTDANTNTNNNEDCFVCYLGESSVGFELSIKCPKIMEIQVCVNGIIWPKTQVTLTNSFHQNEDEDLNVNENDNENEDKSNNDTSNRNGNDTGNETDNEINNDNEYIIVGGLAPLTQYDIEIVQISPAQNLQNRKIIGSCSVTTTPPKSSSSLNSLQIPPTFLSPQCKGKSSGESTLRSALEIAKSSIVEAKQNLKKIRNKDSKSLNKLKSEITTLRSNIGNSNSNDERSWRKILSLRGQVKAIQEAHDSIKNDLEALIIKEESIKDEHLKCKREWEPMERKLNKLEDEFRILKESNDKNISNLENDKDNVYTVKLNKLIKKSEKLNDEVKKMNNELITSKNSFIYERATERNKRKIRRDNVFKEFTNGIARIEQKCEELKSKIQYYANEIQRFETSGLNLNTNNNILPISNTNSSPTISEKLKSNLLNIDSSPLEDSRSITNTMLL